jgi:hypothetical protein
MASEEIVLYQPGVPVADDFKDRFLAERARAMATVILTRRDDLTIAETKDDTGLDYHVYVGRGGKAVRAMFGVLLRGVMSPVTPEHANTHKAFRVKRQ